MRTGPADIFYYRLCRSICASRNIEGALVDVLNLARLFRNEIDPKLMIAVKTLQLTINARRPD